MRSLLLVIALVGCRKSEDSASRPTTGTTPVGATTGLVTGVPTGSTTPPACPVPDWAPSRGGDASSDARSGDPWFVEVEVSGLSDDVTTSGVAWVDLDQDGDQDALLSRDTVLQFLRNDGCLDFVPTSLDAGGATGDGLAGAMAVDFDRDGLLDLYVAGSGADDQSLLLMADGSWDRFVDRAVDYGVANPGAYVRGGASVADIDGDDWLDIAVGGHQIGGGVLQGRPLSRLFRFAPGASGWSDGSFVDLAGSAVPGFGGYPVSPCVPGGEATGLDATLADVDGDGHVDLLWASHNDMYTTTAGDLCATGTHPYGIRLWRGQGDGTFVESLEGDGLVDQGRMNWNSAFGYYVVGSEGPAIGAETLTFFDPDNDGDRDLIALGPTDPDWAVSAGMTTSGQPGSLVRYLRNDGGIFTDATLDSGLAVLDQTLGQWGAFFDHPVPSTSSVMDAVCAAGPQQPLCAGLMPSERQPYPGHALPFDADNDGWVDLLFVNRQCSYNPGPDDDFRSVLLHNQGDGTFEPMVTELSGVVGCGLAGFAVDMDADGWLDLHLIARDELQQIGDFGDRVLWNAGRTGPNADRHWVQLTLEGLPEARLLGARVMARDTGGAVVATGWVEREAWRGSVEPVVHLGLGTVDAVTVDVRLRDGTTATFTPTVDTRSALTL